MNKYLLITGLGSLFLSDSIAQGKVAYPIPRSVVMPVPATFSLNDRQRLEVDDQSIKQNKLIGLTASGDTLFTGGWKRNQLQGEWNSWYNPAKPLDSGRLEKAIPDGVWKSWYPDGSLRSIRTFHAEKLAYVKNEIRRKDARNTFYVLTDLAKENMAAAQYLMTASYSFHSPGHAAGLQQQSLESRILFNISNNAYFPPFTECLHHGLYMNYFPGGNVKDSGYYKNGVRDGLWNEWNAESTVLATGLYKRGKPNGDWKFYNRQGKLLYIRHFNANGKLKQEIRLKG